MQSGPGIRRRSRRSGGGSLQGGGRELERKNRRPRARRTGRPPVAFPPALVPVPIPAFGGGREASSRCRTPPPPSPGRSARGEGKAGAERPLRPALTWRLRCSRGAAAGLGRRAAPPTSLSAITHPRILFIHKNTVMQ